MINPNFNSLLSNNLTPMIGNDIMSDLGQMNNNLFNMNNIPIDYMYIIQYQQALINNMQNFELFRQVKSPEKIEEPLNHNVFQLII